jgi:photosystem II stability/assembly factor-like uncharacterized protein
MKPKYFILTIMAILFSMISIGVAKSHSLKDTADELCLTSDHYIVYENDLQLTVFVERKTVSLKPVSIDYQLIDGTAIASDDYSPVSGQLLFEPSETLKKINIPIINNDKPEIFESFTIVLTTIGSGVSITKPSQAVITILDDDQCFQFQSPYFPKTTVNDLWQSPDGNLWAVCSRGLVLLYEKNSQIGARDIPTNTNVDLNAIWGTNTHNIYVAGNDGIMLHYNGNKFSKISTPTQRDLFAIWGTESGFLVAGGEGHTIIQRSADNHEWEIIKQGRVYDPNINSIWGNSEYYVFAAGGPSEPNDDSNGIIDHYYLDQYHGPRWETMHKQAGVSFTDLTGVSNNIHVCGANTDSKGIIGSFNGHWTIQEIDAGPVHRILCVDNKYLFGLQTTMDNTVVSIGQIKNLQWLSCAGGPTEKMMAICGSSVFDMSIAGESGNIYQFNGLSWNIINDPLKENLNAIWGVDRYLFAVGNHGAIFHSEGFYWAKAEGVPDIQLNDIFGFAYDHIYAVGNGGIMLFFNGYSWHQITSPTTTNLQAIWGNTTDSIFAVGDGGTIISYDGSEWTPMVSPTTFSLNDLSASGQDIIAVGNSGIILRLNGHQWHIMKAGSSDQQDLMAVWADPDSSKAYAVGRFGVVFEYQDPSWKQIRSMNESYASLNDVIGFSNNNIIACDSNGNLLTYNAPGWTRIPLQTSQSLNALWTDTNKSIITIGQNGTVLRYAAPLILNTPQQNISEGDIIESGIEIIPEKMLLSDLDIYLQSMPVNDVFLNSPVTIPANAVSVSFVMQIPSDNISDGAKWTGIYASAPGYQRDVRYIHIMDANDGHLSLQLPAEINESSAMTECMLTLLEPASETIDIWISNNQPEQIRHPETVQIPMGYTTVMFYVSPVDDFWLDGPQAVVIEAMVPGWSENVTQTIVVTDNEHKILSIEGPLNERECTPNPIVEMWISLSGISEHHFPITITHSNPTEISVPTMITAWAGAKVISVPIEILDDHIIDGTQAVQMTVSASGWKSASYTMNVEDNEPGKVELAFETFYAYENQDFATVTLIRNESDVGDITITCNTFGGNALAFEDYMPVTRTIQFESGVSYQTIKIPLIQNQQTESNESVFIRLSAVTEDWLDGQTIAEIMIQDDEWQGQWQSPLPQGNTLNGIVATSAHEMIAVGDKGLIIHRTYSEWFIQKQLTTEDIKDVFAIDSTHVYAVGDNGLFLFYNGINWSRQSSFMPHRVNAIWGTDTDNLFAVGEHSGICSNHDNLWHPIYENSDNDPELYDVWGASKDAVFFVGGYPSLGSIYFWDGINVNPMIVPKCPTLHCVWGTDSNNVYAAGDECIILHYNGSEWQIIHHGDSSGDQSCILSLWGIDDNTIFAAGGDSNGGFLLSKKNNTWEPYDQSFPQWLTHISGWNNHFVAVGVMGMAYEYTLTDDSWISIVKGQTSDITDIWGRNADDIYAVGYDNTFKHYTNSNWQSLTLTNWSSFHGVYGNETTVFAVGAEGTILSYENNQIQYHSSKTDVCLKDIWGMDQTFFAVGEEGTILQYTGTNWNEMFHLFQNQDLTINNVWGTALNQVFVVGEQNLIEYFDGNQWNVQNGPANNANQTIFSIWGKSPDDYYITCDSGKIFQYFENNWLDIEDFTLNQYDIFGWNNNIVTVGDAGVRLLDNSGWNELEKMTSNTLYCAWAIDNQIFVAGYGGTQILYTGHPIVEDHEPQITPISNQTISGSSPLLISLNLFDPDGDALTLTITSSDETIINNQDISINGKSNQEIILLESNELKPITITCQTSKLATGSTIIQLNVSDSKGMTDCKNFTLTVVKEYTVTVMIIPENSTISPEKCGTIYVNDKLCSKECAYVFSENEKVRVLADAMPGYHFTSWAKDISGEDPVLTVVVDSNLVLGAIFQENERPVIVQPENGEIIPDSTVTLIGGIFKGDDQNIHYRTFWKIRVVDHPYTCTELNFFPTSSFCYESNSTPVTAHVLTKLITGYQYAWKFGYKNTSLTDHSFSGTLWSDENFFTIGQLEKDTGLSIKECDSALDYQMISIVQWFPEPLAGATFGANLHNGYNPSIIRIGMYNPLYGDYQEYTPDMKTLPGQSFWVLSRANIPLVFAGVPVTTRYPVEIKLNYGKDGWNMIACPNRASYAWERIQILSYDENGNAIDMDGNLLPKEKIFSIADLSLSSTNKWINPILWLWEEGEGNYRQTKYLDPYKGYWVKVYQSNLSLRFIPDAQIDSDHTRKRPIERKDIETPPLPMNAFDSHTDGIGSGCFISVIEN